MIINQANYTSLPSLKTGLPKTVLISYLRGNYQLTYKSINLSFIIFMIINTEKCPINLPKKYSIQFQVLCDLLLSDYCSVIMYCLKKTHDNTKGQNNSLCLVISYMIPWAKPEKNWSNLELHICNYHTCNLHDKTTTQAIPFPIKGIPSSSSLTKLWEQLAKEWHKLGIYR